MTTIVHNIQDWTAGDQEGYDDNCKQHTGLQENKKVMTPIVHNIQDWTDDNYIDIVIS